MAKVIENMSVELAAAVESAEKAVVRVEGRRRLPASGIIWSKEGHIVTAHHVVERDERLKVRLAEGKSRKAKLIGRDPTTDLALLQVDGIDESLVERSEMEALRVGHLVLALGRPGRTVQATLGIVSALGDSWRTRSGGTVDRYLQTDVVMYPGFSGGPLINMQGQLLGLNTSALRGVSLTIPNSTVARVIESLSAHGKVRRGYLGVGLQPVQLPQALAEELDQETGLILVSVDPGSPADESGMTLGDTLLSFDGEPVRTLDDLLGQLSGELVEKEVPVRLLRGGEIREHTVVVGERQ